MKNSLTKYLSLGSKPGRIPELDGIRAWAILLVLGHHFATFYREYNGSYYRHVITGPWENWLLNGWLGVDLFFVLSGYLIFHHLMSIQSPLAEGLTGENHNNTPSDIDNRAPQQLNKKEAYKRYALKRILRTFPLYYAMILIAVIGVIPYFKPEISWSELVTHVLFLQDYLGSDILTPMWSLATEEKFYLLAPLLLFLTRWPLHKSLLLMFILFLVLITTRTLEIISAEQITGHIQFFKNHRAPFHYAVLSILIGVVVALVEHKKAPQFAPFIFVLTLMAVVVLLFGFNFYRVTHWHWLSVAHFILVILFGVLLWLAVKLTGTVWWRWFTGRILRVISVLSYSLYLAHYAVLPWVLNLHRQHIYSETPWIHAGTFLLIYVGLSLAVSLMLHYLVEKPFLLLKERL